jgi:hypothetical protein
MRGTFTRVNTVILSYPGRLAHFCSILGAADIPFV